VPPPKSMTSKVHPHLQSHSPKPQRWVHLTSVLCCTGKDWQTPLNQWRYASKLSTGTVKIRDSTEPSWEGSSCSIICLRNHSPTCSNLTIFPSSSGKKSLNICPNPPFEAAEESGVTCQIETLVAHCLPNHNLTLTSLFDVEQTGNQRRILTQLQ
jgi:hypothetical protein